MPLISPGHTEFSMCIECGYIGHRTTLAKNMVNRGTDVEYRCPECRSGAVVGVVAPTGYLWIDEGQYQ